MRPIKRSYHSSGEFSFSKRLLLGASLSVLAFGGVASSAQAGPSGGTVTMGDATITTNGSTTTINQNSARAVIEWQNFSIGAGELAKFIQGSSSAAVLNKVISSLPSHILGQIQANGNVYLVNPNGIVVGAGAQINANSFIASTLNLSSQQFMDGGDLTFKGESAAAIVNLGEINASQGDVYLIARKIENAGKISAKRGEVGLAAGTEVYLSTGASSGSRITVKVDDDFVDALKDNLPDGASIENKGIIEAARVVLESGGHDLYDKAINNSGVISATSISHNADGSIRLTSAKGSGRGIVNSGTLTARNMNGTGGKIEVLADHTHLASASVIDVSGTGSVIANPPSPKAKPDNRGTNGGGTVLIGGDYKGGSGVQTAETVTMDEGSIITANAVETGDGGKVILWSNHKTQVAGTIEAKGGDQGGNGGFIETSSKDKLTIAETTSVQIAAPQGRGGEWLLDPSDITISDSGGDVNTSTINATLNGGGSVTIETASGVGGNGDITLSNATIDKSASNNAATFTLLADRHIQVSNSTINSTSGDALTVVLNANTDSTDGGRVSIQNSTINTSGGGFVVGGGSDPLTTAAIGTSSLINGVLLTNAHISTGSGDVSIRGAGFASAGGNENRGILVQSGSTISTTTGDITLVGTGGTGSINNHGIAMSLGSVLTTAYGDISLTGQGGGDGSGTSSSNKGVLLTGASQITSTGTGANAGTVTLNGVGGAGQDSNIGVELSGASVVTSVDGAILFTGEGASNGSAGTDTNRGITIGGGATVSSTGTGVNAATITLNGRGGDGEDGNRGVSLNNAILTSAYGDIAITGQGGSNGTVGSNGNQGVMIENSSLVSSTGTGANAATITLDGTGGNGEDSNRGIYVHNSNIASVDGDVSLTGRGGSKGTDDTNSNHGVLLQNSRIDSTGTTADAARITLDGTSGLGYSDHYGISLDNGHLESVIGHISLTGQGHSVGTVGSSRTDGIVMFNAASLTSTGTGANAATITLNGTAGAGEDDNNGILLGSGAFITSVDGAISLTGRGASNSDAGSNANDGIFLGTNTYIESTGTGSSAATITLDGTGGAGEDGNRGVDLFSNTARITSVDGDIVITGRGGSNGIADSDDNHGVYVRTGFQVTSTGEGADAANITIDGIAGAGEDVNLGVLVNGLLTTTDGDILITGRGSSNGTSASSYNLGVQLSHSSGGRIVSLGNDDGFAGTITIDGTGGAGGSGTNYGVRLIGDNTPGTLGIESAYGDVSITGQGGTTGADGSDGNRGILLDTAFELESTGTGANAAKITLHGTGGASDDENQGVDIKADSIIRSIDGDISITGIGYSDGSDDSRLNRGVVLSGNALIESTGTGADAAKITITGTGGAGGDENRGININDAMITSVDGDILLIGQGGSNGGGDSNANRGIFLENAAGISSTGTTADAAKITLIGAGGNGSNSNHGIDLGTSSAASYITSAYGDISLTGTAGSNGSLSSQYNYGVQIYAGSNITSTGTGANAAKITINGTGGTGELAGRGITLVSGGFIESVDGDILLTGVGGSNRSTTSNSNPGIFMSHSGTAIRSTGTTADAATITLNGTGGMGGGNSNRGLQIQDSSLVTSAYGDISIVGHGGSTGIAGSNSNKGINLASSAVISSTGTGATAANITLTGIGADGDASNEGVEVNGSSRIETVDGDIVIDGTAGQNSAFSNFTSGFLLTGSALISSTGTGADAGNITITGRSPQRGVSMGASNDPSSFPLVLSSVDGDITITGQGNGTSYEDIRQGDLSISTTGDGNLTYVGNSLTTLYDIAVNVGGDLSFLTRTDDTKIDIGSAFGVTGDNNILKLDQNELNYYTVGGDITIGNSTSTGIVTIDGLDVFPGYNIYGGSIKASNLTNIDGSTTTITARTGDFTLFDTSFFNGGNSIDEVKANFQTLAGDLILAGDGSSSMGVAGGAGANTLTAGDLSGFAQIGGNLIIGDPNVGTSVINVSSGGAALDVSGETYGLGFYGDTITFDGNVSTGGDLDIAGDTINWNGYNMYAQNDIVVKTQNAALDIDVSHGAGTGALVIDDATIGRLHAAQSGSGNLVIGEESGGSGFITIDGLNLATEAYGLKFYGQQINLLNDASLSSGADLELAADTLSVGNAAINAKGEIALHHMTAGRTIAINEVTDKLQYNGLDQVSLSQLNYNSDAVGSEGLTIGNNLSGDMTWYSDTADLTTYTLATGGDLRLVTSDATHSYGLGDGTTGDINWTTAQMESLGIGGDLIIGDSVGGTGAVQIADINGGYGLNAVGGTIQIGAWNGGTGNISLRARTGDITGTGGTISGTNMVLSATGGVIGTPLVTDISNLTYTTGGDLRLTNAGDLDIINGTATSAGTVDIATTNGDISIQNGLTIFGDTTITAGGAGKNVNHWSNGISTSHATTASTLNLRADGSIRIWSNSNISNSNGQALNVILNSDRDGDEFGAIVVNASTVTTNGGDFIAGGGADPLTGYAWGTSDNRYGIEMNGGTVINTGAGRIATRGHGYKTLNQDFSFGQNINNATLQTTGGDITMNGVGGNRKVGLNGANEGIKFTNATVSSVTGDIDITGRGGDSFGASANIGLQINTNSVIESIGTDKSTAGTITLTGIAGQGTDGNNGILLSGASAIESVAGDIVLHGTGGGNNRTNSDGNRGLSILNSARIESTGTGVNAANITLTGVGGTGEDSNRGVDVSLGAQILSVDGDIILNGTGGGNGQTTAQNNAGIAMFSSALIRSTGTTIDAGKITLNGTGGNSEDSNHGVQVNDATISSAYGDVALTGIGGSNGQRGSNFNHGVEIGGGANVISTGLGSTAAKITLNGTGGAGEDNNFGFNISDADISSQYGDITLIGVGATNGQKGSNYARGGIVGAGSSVVSGGVGANAAKITIHGTAGAGEDNSRGFELSSGSSILSKDGDILITGIGNSNGHTGSDTGYGITFYEDTRLESTGVGADAATITLNGTGGNGRNANYGIYSTGAGAGQTITSVDGDIILNGVGSSNGQSNANNNIGIYLLEGTVVRSTGVGAEAAKITLNGTAGSSLDDGYGVRISGANALITSVDGDISATGTGISNGLLEGDSNMGLRVQAGAILESTGMGDDAANITIVGTGGYGDQGNNGVYFGNNDTEIRTVDGDINITGTGNAADDDFSNLNYGFWLTEGAKITSSGATSNAGNINIFGEGATVGTTNTGIRIKGNGTIGASITANQGNVRLTGIRGNNSGSGISMTESATLTAHDVSLITDNLGFSSPATMTANNNFTIQNYTAGASIGFQDGTTDNLYINNGQLSRLIVGNELIIGGANTGLVDIDNATLSAGAYDVSVTGTSINLTDGFAVNGDLTLNTDAIEVSGGNVTTADALTITPLTASTSIGLGGGAGDLNLTDVELAFLRPTNTLSIGDSTYGTGSIIIDSVDLSGMGYDLSLYGRGMLIRNGLSVDGTLNAISNGGDIAANSVISTKGTGLTLTLAALGRNVTSILGGASFLDADAANGGYYNVYSKSAVQSGLPANNAVFGVSYGDYTGTGNRVIFENQAGNFFESFEPRDELLSNTEFLTHSPKSQTFSYGKLFSTSPAGKSGEKPKASVRNLRSPLQKAGLTLIAGQATEGPAVEQFGKWFVSDFTRNDVDCQVSFSADDGNVVCR